MPAPSGTNDNIILFETGQSETARLVLQHEVIKYGRKGLIKAPIDLSKPGLKILDQATADALFIFVGPALRRQILKLNQLCDSKPETLSGARLSGERSSLPGSTNHGTTGDHWLVPLARVKQEHHAHFIVTRPSAEVDNCIIFVHGLSGHPIKSWSTEASNSKTQRKRPGLFKFFKQGNNSELPDAPDDGSVFWPRDLLPEDVPNARIVTYGYDSDALKMFAASNQNNIFQHAQNMLASIQRIRAENPERPVVFVCHSLGGIITKEALRLSQAAKYRPNLKGLYEHTYGVIFLGTPHRGSTWAPWGALAGNLTKLAFQSPNISLLKSLEVDSQALQMIADEFSTMIREDIRVYSFREEKGMSGIYGLHEKVVDDFSAIIGDAAEGKEGINANHRDMCKYGSRDDDGYRKVSGEIRRFVTAASGRSKTLRSENNSSSVENWPDFIPIQARQKILRDKPYNHINFDNNNAAATIQLPFFNQASLSASVTTTAPKTLYLGNSVFELADVLQLLPEQPNSHLLSVEEIPLNQIAVDERNYFTRISQVGVLRLACQHFHSVSETDETLSVRTSIGTFQFTHTDNGNVVRFTARERSTTCIAPDNQDFDALQQSALGRFCTRENLNIHCFDDNPPPIGPPEWTVIRPRDVVAVPHLSHAECLRFLTTEDYAEFQREYKFLDTMMRQIFDILVQRPNYFDVETSKWLGLVKGIFSKAPSTNKDFHVAVASSLASLHCLRTMPSDLGFSLEDGGETPEVAGSRSASTIKSQSPITDGGEGQEVSMVTMLATANAVSIRTPDEVEIDTAVQNFLEAVMREVRILESINNTARPDEAMRARLTELGSSQLKLLAGIAAVLIIWWTNAKIIIATSVPAPNRWLQLLGSAEADILVA